MADGSDPFLAIARFLVFVAVAVAAPGVGLQRLARVRSDPALVLPLGLTFCACAYWLSLAAGAPLLFPLLAVMGALTLAAPGMPGGRTEGPPVRGVLLPLALLVALFALTQYRVNRVGADGAFLLDVGEHADTALHVGVTWELVAGYPPQVPGLAGVPMRYHVGSHLVRAAAARWAGIHPYDAISRFDITLWALALVLVLRATAHELGLGRAAVGLAGFLPLASDLSFLPGLVLGAQWWALRLGGNFIEALFFANSITPALALALGVVTALARAERGEGRGFVVLAAVLAAGTGFFKVFTGAQLLLSLAIAWLVDRGRSTLLAALIPGAVALLSLALGTVSPTGAGGVTVALVPFAPVNPARAAFGLPEVRGVALLAWGLAWAVLSLGLRAVGIPGAWRALREGGTARSALGAFALGGWPLGMLLSITADPRCDESFYFLQASGVVLWLFAASAIRQATRPTAALALAAALFCLPSTLEFLARKATQPPERLPAAAVEAMAALRADSCPGDVVITRPLPRYVPLPVVLAGRRVAFSNYIGYWRQFIAPEALSERDRLVRSFFRATDAHRAIDVAARLGARYAYLSGQQKVDFDPEGVLEPVFSRDGERVYRIVPLASSPCDSGSDGWGSSKR